LLSESHLLVNIFQSEFSNSLSPTQPLHPLALVPFHRWFLKDSACKVNTSEKFFWFNCHGLYCSVACLTEAWQRIALDRAKLMCTCHQRHRLFLSSVLEQGKIDGAQLLVDSIGAYQCAPNTLIFFVREQPCIVELGQRATQKMYTDFTQKSAFPFRSCAKYVRHRAFRMSYKQLQKLTWFGFGPLRDSKQHSKNARWNAEFLGACCLWEH
jgi:hypothetical protein